MTFRDDRLTGRGAGVALGISWGRGGEAGVAYGISWGRKEKGRLLAALLVGFVMITTLGSLSSRASAATAGPRVSVIVRALPGNLARAEQAARDAGGRVGRTIHIVNGFGASVPSGAIRGLRDAAGVYSVTRDAPVHLAAHALAWRLE